MSGTTPTEADKRTPWSTTEICRILEVGAKVGVQELRFHGLHVRFGRPAESLSPGPALARPSIPSSAPPEKAISEEQHNKQTQDALEADELRLKEDRLAQLFIENPLEAERMLMNGELGDAEESDESEALD
ncbi:MAG: hypothetical protein JNL01_14080 [Bdellovibrionales bacterium]|nr:hypothetical protein [Bdellovibrionales bacterium]